MPMVVAIGGLLLVGCGTGADAEDRSVEVVVSAAASLADVVTELAVAFEASHPGVDVVANVGGSSSLREQLLGGAPADVFAPADHTVMDDVVAAGLVVGTPSTFATNELVLAVPAGNPAGVTGIDDLARPELFVGVCRRAVPCGAAADRALAAAGVTAALDTREADVRAVLARLVAGELDAGFVYATDVLAAAGAVEQLPLPPAARVTTSYPVAVLTAGDAPDAAADLVAFLLGPVARELLVDHGFGVPA